MDTFAGALPPIFLYVVPIALAGFMLSWFIAEKPPATTVGGVGAGRPQTGRATSHVA